MRRWLFLLSLALFATSCAGEEPAADPVAPSTDAAGSDAPVRPEICKPDCSGQACGAADGCEGFCGGLEPKPEDPEADALAVIVNEAIVGGLALGRDLLMESVQEQLTGYQISDVDLVHWSVTDQEPPPCPLESGETAPVEGMECGMILDLARVQAVSSLDQVLDDNPFLEGLEQPEDAAEVRFWYEEAALAAVDLWALALIWDLEASGLCAVDGSTAILAGRRGYIQGADLMAQAFNDWLTDLGHEPSYPTMSQGTDLCGPDFFGLETPLADAQQRVDEARSGPGPCDLSEPPDEEQTEAWTAERDAWEEALQQGVEDEHNLLGHKLRFVW